MRCKEVRVLQCWLYHPVLFTTSFCQVLLLGSSCQAAVCFAKRCLCAAAWWVHESYDDELGQLLLLGYLNLFCALLCSSVRRREVQVLFWWVHGSAIRRILLHHQALCISERCTCFCFECTLILCCAIGWQIFPFLRVWLPRWDTNGHFWYFLLRCREMCTACTDNSWMSFYKEEASASVSIYFSSSTFSFFSSLFQFIASFYQYNFLF